MTWWLSKIIKRLVSRLFVSLCGACASFPVPTALFGGADRESCSNEYGCELVMECGLLKPTLLSLSWLVVLCRSIGLRENATTEREFAWWRARHERSSFSSSSSFQLSVVRIRWCHTSRQCKAGASFREPIKIRGAALLGGGGRKTVGQYPPERLPVRYSKDKGYRSFSERREQRERGFAGRRRGEKRRGNEKDPQARRQATQSLSLLCFIQESRRSKIQ